MQLGDDRGLESAAVERQATGDGPRDRSAVGIAAGWCLSCEVSLFSVFDRRSASEWPGGARSHAAACVVAVIAVVGRASL